MSNYQNTCPKRTVITVHHTIQTWLPVTLSCGHVEKVNWTARAGEVMGCISCQHALDDANQAIDAVEGAHNLEQSLDRGFA